MMIIISDRNKIPEIHRVITASFHTVADEFGYTSKNVPTFPAFIPESSVTEMFDRGAVFIGWMDNGPNRRAEEDKIGAVVAVELAHDDLYYLERLSVLPEYRRLGLGRKLMDSAFDEVRKRGGKRISIAVVDTNTVLKEWYIKYGFRIVSTKHYDHLPFPVTFMKKEV